VLLKVGFAVLLCAALALLGGWLLLRGSLPALDGQLALADLGARVAIERDARGRPTLRARSRDDLAFATGFVHAEDRFFQMDLERRLAAGELAELLGPPGLTQDRRARLFRFRAVARSVVAAATPAERSVLEAYSRGVNAGLAQLASRPWEYWLLGLRPAPWREEDSVLCGLSIWWQLQYGALDRARARHAVERAIIAQGSSDPSAALEFLYPRGTLWDAPLASSPGAPPPHDPTIPAAAVLDLRRRVAPIGVQIVTSRGGPDIAAGADADAADAAVRAAGSNNFALGGALTADGAALVANDMHLTLGVPATWYPMRLVVEGERAPSLDLSGVTLPGTPMLVAGSNGAVAWGFTNSYGDWLDVTRMRCPAPGQVIRPDGVQESFTTFTETIAVHDRPAVRLEVETAPSGIQLSRSQGTGKSRDDCDLVAWLAAVPAATNLRLLELERVDGVDAALALAPGIGIPHQNLVLGDALGHIAWTVIGRIPDDRGAAPFLRNTGLLPWRDAATQPQVLDPPDARLWTANARVVDGAAETILGGQDAAVGAGYDLGARARQLRDDLARVHVPAAPADMLAIQLDDRALFLGRWQRHLLELLDPQALAGHFERAEFRRLIADWGGRAEPGSVSYRLVRTFHAVLEDRAWRLILWALDARDDAGEPLASAPPPQFEGPLWQLVTARPLHLLPVTATSWRAFELEALDATLDQLARSCRTLASCGYEATRPVRIRHPLAPALPEFLAAYVDMPALRLPGDHDMPRVQDGAFGASERFAVEPGHEASGYLELPGGPSGHPLSPYYRSEFDAWAEGQAAGFQPGPAVHTLELTPTKLPSTR
jgi:penicillin amidase